MRGLVQEMTRLGGEVGGSTRDRTRTASRRAQEVKSFLQSTRTERRIQARQQQRRLKDFHHATRQEVDRMRREVEHMRRETRRLLDAMGDALKDSLVQFVRTNRSSVSVLRAQTQRALDRLRTDFRGAARTFRDGLGRDSKPTSKGFPEDKKAASATMLPMATGFSERAEDKKGLGKRGVRSK